MLDSSGAKEGIFRLFLIGSGGFIGSIARYALAGWVHRLFGTPWFPYGTLSVNVIGCLLIGYFMGLTELRQLFNPDTRAFLFIGLLGGFTTFSTFGFETFALLRDGEYFRTVMNISLHLSLGLAGVWVGYVTSQYT